MDEAIGMRVNPELRVAGMKPGRQSETERTLAINLGLALDDMATAPLILQRAREKGLGTLLPL